MKSVLSAASLSALLLPLFLAGCAADPLREGVTGPDWIAAHPTSRVGESLEWAGVVVRIENHETETLLEVLSYPITHSGRPSTSSPPNGRFLATRQGYLEPMDFASGRRVTVRGVLREVLPGRVGGREYAYPVLEMTGITLWSRSPPADDRPRFRIGIGVGVGL